VTALDGASLHREAVTTLTSWRPPTPDQDSLRLAFLSYLAVQPDAWSRECAPGHLTASTLVIDEAHERVLLILHPRVGLWVQPGGHCEPGDSTLAGVALREATEESGIGGIILDPTPLHLSVHPITCSAGVPTRHLDVTFLGIAPRGAQAHASAESMDLAWWPVHALPSEVDTLPELVALATRRLGRRRRQGRQASRSRSSLTGNGPGNGTDTATTPVTPPSSW
jgi:8-oxo-dGTP pyrophosphatase MutT (NUDIX family)